MTLLEKAFEIEKGQIEKNQIVETNCPYDYNLGLDLDSDYAYNKDLKITGCRGISCEECWNKEAGEGNDI
jgi:hypothetical protein